MFWGFPIWNMERMSPVMPFLVNVKPAQVSPPLIIKQQNVLEENHSENEANADDTEQFLRFFDKLIAKRYQKFSKRIWQREEDELLLSLQEKGMSWQEISTQMKVQSWKNCARRWERLKKKREKWPKELQQAIRFCFEVEGKKWKNIAIQIRKRFGTNICYPASVLRDHYYNFLKPGIERRVWSKEEDSKVMELILKYGTSWSVIKDYFPGRTELDLKNRYHGFLKPFIRRAERSTSRLLRKRFRLTVLQQNE